MLYLARHWQQGAVLIADIAQEEQLPRKFLDAILLEMRNDGMLSSKKGKGGGYMLAIPPDQIPVGRIVRALDGPLAPVPCVSRTAYRPCGDCHDEHACAIRAVMQEARDAIAAVLDNTSLADMLNRQPKAEHILDYVI